MVPPMHRTFTLIAALALLTAACSSTEPSAATAAPVVEPSVTSTPAEPESLLEALEQSGQADPGIWAEHEGIVAFVAPAFDTGLADPGAAATAYFDAFAGAYGVADPEDRLQPVGSDDTAAGTVVRFRQVLDGLEVFAGDVTVAVDPDGVVTRVTGVLAPDATLPASVLTADDAIAAALAALPGMAAGPDAPRQVAFSPAVESASADGPVPAWEFVVISGDDVPIRHLVVVDAVTGAILIRAAIDTDAEQWDVYDAENAVDDEGDSTIEDAELMIETRGGTATIVGEPDEVALAVAGHMATAWGYFSSTHERDGHDGEGGKCRIYVHVGVNWRNATAGGASCTQRYGDAKAYAESIDVVAHEFTHAVTGQTAGLIYEGSSGAVNEHYSDFFATMVDTSDWAISQTSRVLSSPAVDTAADFVVTEEDDGGVHDNSGIANMAGYLVANPGLNTHPGSGDEVNGIGRAKAEQLLYATLLSLTPRTGLGAWACATIATATDMEGGLLTGDDVDAVTAAMVAVGLVEEPEIGAIVCDSVSGGSGSGGTEPGPSGGTTTTTGTEPGPSESTTSTTEPDSADACGVVGRWRLRDQEFFEEISRASGGLSGEIEYVSGDYFVELDADGTAIGTRVAWTFRVSSSQGDLVTEISSVDVGEYTIDGQRMTVTQPGGEAEVRLWVEQGGVLTPVPLGATQTVTMDALAGGSATYTCVGDVLTMFMDAEDGVTVTAIFDRIG